MLTDNFLKKNRSTLEMVSF